MKIHVTIKSLGKKNNYLTKKELELSSVPKTLRDLLSQIIKINVQAYIDRQEGVDIVKYLTKEEIELQHATGKIANHANYNTKKINPEDAIKAGSIAFEEGLYKVFIRETEVEELDNPIEINDGDGVVFIKLTMLSGRTW